MSPDPPRDTRAFPPTDTRDAERISMLGELHGEVMVFQPTVVRAISRSGATLETRFPLHLNSLHDVRLTLGPTVKARVVHSRISEVDQDVVTYRSGVEFVEPSEHAVRAIERFLHDVKANRSGV